MSLIMLLTCFSSAPCILWTALPDQEILAVACPGDVNGNGTEDVVAAAGCSEAVAGLWCVDGRTGTTLWFAELPGVYGPDCLCRVSDLDGDMVDDVVVGACDAAPPCQGRVLAVSGADGHVLWDSPNDSYGTVWAVASSSGPTGDLPVVHASVWVDLWITFLTLDGLDGDTLWSFADATVDPGIHTMEDFSGNGWGEMGYSEDRGSVTSGVCRIYDGRTGSLLFQVWTMYFGRMDMCDSPSPMMAVGQWGNMSADLRLVTLPSGTELYGLSEYQVIYSQIRFVRDVFGGSLPSPVLVGWNGAEMNLICGTWGEVSGTYIYDAPIIDFVGCQMNELDWRLAVLTGNSLYLTEPTLYGGSTGSSVALPAIGKDLCLLSTDQYPSPLAAVGLAGSGPGLCALVTSWPEGVEEEDVPPSCSGVSLESNPGQGGIMLRTESGGSEATVFDMTGRKVAETGPLDAGETFVPLLPGVYLVADVAGSFATLRAVVLGDR